MCRTFQESIYVCCQVLEEFLGELGSYEKTEVRVEVNKISWKEILSMKNMVEGNMHGGG